MAPYLSVLTSDGLTDAIAGTGISVIRLDRQAQGGRTGVIVAPTIGAFGCAPSRSLAAVAGATVMIAPRQAAVTSRSAVLKGSPLLRRWLFASL